MSPDATDEPCDEPGLLFAYGTLSPAKDDPRASSPWLADAVRGWLYDLGPYPALIGLDEPDAGWIEGHVRPVGRAELIDELDPYEGVAQGLFVRCQTLTRSGRRVWVYTYSRPVPASARGPLSRWDGRRRRLPQGAATPLPRSASPKPPILPS